MPYIIGTDTGGTFTDCVAIDDHGRVFTDKAPSTPGDLTTGILESISRVAEVIGISRHELLRQTTLFAHGTTAALNCLCTRSGPSIGLITTAGHEDAILIGRVSSKVAGLVEREITHAVHLSKPDPIVPRPRIIGVQERVDYQGEVLVPLDLDEARRAVGALRDAGVRSIAVSLLWAFMHPAHEQSIGDLVHELDGDIYVTLSSEIAPVIKEYERTATTAINAYLGPTVHAYVSGLEAALREAGLAGPLLLMQSMGGVIPAEEAGRKAVHILSSGPVGGVMGSVALGRALGIERIITTDVGGTSFDVGLIVDGRPQLAREPVYEKYRLLVPAVDVVSIGAGGGSIAWIEPHSGLLRVGPASAGASPGPVCYGRGGTEPTVTDADLVLGRLNPEHFLGGRIHLDLKRAEAAIREKIAAPLGLDVAEAARGIIDIVDAHMADLVRKATIERGYDPRDFVLFAYGGGGPTHVGAYGRDLGASTAVVSPYAPVFSAFGIAGSDAVRYYARSEPLLVPLDPEHVNAVYHGLEEQARADLARAGFQADRVTLTRSADVKFRRQVNELQVPVPAGRLDQQALASVVEEFGTTYERIYGRGTAYWDAGVEFTTFRLVASAALPKPVLSRQPLASEEAQPALKGRRSIYFDGHFIETDIYEVGRLRPGNALRGPAVVEGHATTLVVHPRQVVRVDQLRNLVLELSPASEEAET